MKTAYLFHPNDKLTILVNHPEGFTAFYVDSNEKGQFFFEDRIYSNLDERCWRPSVCPLQAA
jgi:hypothetical protein